MLLSGADNRGTVADAVADADPVSDMEVVELLEIEHLAKMSRPPKASTTSGYG